MIHRRHGNQLEVLVRIEVRIGKCIRKDVLVPFDLWESLGAQPDEAWNVHMAYTVSGRDQRIVPTNILDHFPASSEKRGEVGYISLS
jgi:hypothetical protein